ncbi:hypothetical protein [Pseudomarimonas arenosa]|uniref:Cobalt/nickel transport protein n=1 Tax=Pseudomarimonas arenosa TaxID=2774145 RepID=A0AAW3ZP34_9GAMM|nr:hypothetical protein [Pseudomarimonas arenosa]MBD8527866.1 hypothetical protein [Pseudomarimonas arenosa]
MKRIGVLLVLLGLFQIAWAGKVYIADSGHMGSILRLNAPALLRTVPSEGQQVAKSILDTGYHGFSLLGRALAFLAVSGTILTATGALLLARRVPPQR